MSELHTLDTAPADGGCSASRCGSSADSVAALPDTVQDKVRKHPCYSEQAHHYYARMHVAVAPACNIQCNYCNRKYDCANESRPGVVSKLLTPAQALKKTKVVAASVPQMSVLGIAGPGDPLANPERTFETLELVAGEAPDVKLCLSTNGLMLPQLAERMVELGVDHITITINAIDPEVGAQIHPWILWGRRKVRGVEAARILITQQLKGLDMLVARGVLVKVNSVMIPGVNDAHLVAVNRVVKERGAFLHNIMPLIARPEHGTVFGLNGQPEPTLQELDALREACAGDMNMMRHCRQCRADAVGLLGEDRGAEFDADRVDAEAVDYPAAMALRQAVHDGIEQDRAEQGADAPESAPDGAVDPAAAPRWIAVATKGQGLVNEHFGHAREFLVYEASPAGVRLVGYRRVDQYCIGEQECGDHDSALERTVAALEDCAAVLCSRVGFGPWQALEAAGIQPDVEHAMEPIEEAVMGVYRRLAAARGAGGAADDQIASA